MIRIGQSSAGASKSTIATTSSEASDAKASKEAKPEPTKVPAAPDLNSLRAKLMVRKRKLTNQIAAAAAKKVSEDASKAPSSANVPANEEKASLSAPQTTASAPEKKTLPGTTTSLTPSTGSTPGPFSAKKPSDGANKIGFGTSSSSVPFGSSTTTPSFANPFGKKDTESKTATGGTFLNLKPPGSGSSTPSFSFGSSSSITLPLPSKATFKAPQMPFTVFGQSTTPVKASGFGTSAGTGLFGTSGKKRPLGFGEVTQSAKQSRVDEGKDNTKETEDKEEGETKE